MGSHQPSPVCGSEVRGRAAPRLCRDYIFLLENLNGDLRSECLPKIAILDGFRPCGFVDCLCFFKINAVQTAKVDNRSAFLG